MNSLSWLLYYADVLPSIAGVFSVVFILLAFAFAAVAGGFTIGYFVNQYEVASRGDTDHSKETYKGCVSMCRTALRSFYFAFGLALTVVFATAFVPSRNTFYMIASSEVGGQIATSPDTKEILEALKAKIMDVLAVAKPK